MAGAPELARFLLFYAHGAHAECGGVVSHGRSWLASQDVRRTRLPGNIIDIAIMVYVSSTYRRYSASAMNNTELRMAADLCC